MLGTPNVYVHLQQLHFIHCAHTLIAVHYGGTVKYHRNKESPDDWFRLVVALFLSPGVGVGRLVTMVSMAIVFSVGYGVILVMSSALPTWETLGVCVGPCCES